MAKPIITPWRYHRDLLEVRGQLYQLNDTDARRHAVDRVMAWKQRGHLPHAVESTALLTDAILHHRRKDSPARSSDENASEHSTANSTFSVRAVYSAAFTRFVTGFCDIGRNRERTLEPSSMLEIARQIGMPPEFVALRHEATHEELPGIQRLVKATDEALKWLWNVYWSRLEEVTPTSVERLSKAGLEELKAEARVVLRGFRAAKLDALRTGGTEPVELVQDCCKAVTKLVNGRAEGMEAFASVIVREGFLWPGKRELKSALDGAYLLWDDLLVNICRANKRLLDVVLHAMLDALSNVDIPDNWRERDFEALSMWLLHLVDETSEWSIFDLRAAMLRHCCLHPGERSYRLGSELLASGTEELRREYGEIFEASQLVDADSSSRPENSRQSTEVESEDVDMRMGPYPPADRSSLGGWYRAPRAPKTPIGVA